jgi:hypothetical protein
MVTLEVLAEAALRRDSLQLRSLVQDFVRDHPVIGPVPEPVFLLESATRMKRLRILCETEAPEPLRKRGLFAPPDFLTFA